VLAVADEARVGDEVAALHVAIGDGLREHVQRFGDIDGDSTCSNVSWFANG